MFGYDNDLLTGSHTRGCPYFTVDDPSSLVNPLDVLVLEVSL